MTHLFYHKTQSLLLVKNFYLKCKQTGGKQENIFKSLLSNRMTEMLSLFLTC